MMPFYRKKPVQIEAVQFDGTPESGAAIVSWANRLGVEEVEFHPFLADYFKGDPKVYVAHPDPYMRIKTLEGVMTASRGDWIIRGVQGEFYPCKPDIFDATYDPVVGDENPPLVRFKCSMPGCTDPATTEVRSMDDEAVSVCARHASLHGGDDTGRGGSDA